MNLIQLLFFFAFHRHRPSPCGKVLGSVHDTDDTVSVQLSGKRLERRPIVRGEGRRPLLPSDGGAVEVGVVGGAGAVRLDHGDLGRVLRAVPRVPVAQALAVVLGEDEQHERVDAAVRVAQADADVVGVDEGDGGRIVGQIEHLDDVVRRPAEEEEADDHQHHLGGPLGPHRLLAFDAADGAEDVVEGERVEGADDDEGDDEAQDGLVEGVPVHVLGPVQVHHAHLHVLTLRHLGVEHDRHSEQEAAQPHQHVDDDGPLEGPLLRGRVDDGDVPVGGRGISSEENLVLFFPDRHFDIKG